VTLHSLPICNAISKAGNDLTMGIDEVFDAKFLKIGAGKFTIMRTNFSSRYLSAIQKKENEDLGTLKRKGLGLGESPTVII
jgi:hypothetical protein